MALTVQTDIKDLINNVAYNAVWTVKPTIARYQDVSVAVAMDKSAGFILINRTKSNFPRGNHDYHRPEWENPVLIIGASEGNEELLLNELLKVIKDYNDSPIAINSTTYLDIWIDEGLNNSNPTGAGPFTIDCFVKISRGVIAIP